MSNFKAGDSVSWIKKMACVPHPEGKTDSHGNVLSVFRDTLINGKIISRGGNNTWFVRPDSSYDFNHEFCGERYFDIRINESEIV